jgi:peptidoglycan/LPS O-acetylase OafA/YrhL
MSLFFLVSGLFLPASVERKGPMRFLKERLLRLGLPIVLFFVLIIPLLTYLYYLNFRPYGWISFFRYYREIYFGGGSTPAGWSGPTWPDMQFGHLWFVQHLLVFSLGYLIYGILERRIAGAVQRKQALPKAWTIALFPIVLTLATATVRIGYPVDRWSAFLGFIQVMWADVPRDLSFFVLGILAGRRDWLRQIPSKWGFLSLASGVFLALFLALTIALELPLLWGGAGGWRYLLFCFWESLFCLTICTGLLVLFREKLDSAGPITRSLAGATYAVYLFHVPVVVGFQYLFAPLDLPPLAAFALVSLCTVPSSFALALLLRRIPGSSLVI